MSHGHAQSIHGLLEPKEDTMLCLRQVLRGVRIVHYKHDEVAHSITAAKIKNGMDEGLLKNSIQ